MMEGDKPLLDVCASPHFLSAAHQDANPSGPNVLKQSKLLRIAVEILNEGNFVFGHTTIYQLFLEVVIDGEASAKMRRRGKIAENQLGRTLSGILFPNLKYLVGSFVHLAVGMIASPRIEKTQVECAFAPFRGDLQHVVFLRIDAAIPQCFRTFRQSRDEFL